MPDDTIPGAPPFAVPLSPTSPTTTAVSSGDWAGNDGSDPEKGIIRESSEENQIAEHGWHPTKDHGENSAVADRV